jgi:hypothetical protein
LGAPHHTAIVETANGTTVTLLHQNMEGDKAKSKVRRDTFNLAGIVRGSYRVYMPIPQPGFAPQAKAAPPAGADQVIQKKPNSAAIKAAPKVKPGAVIKSP